MSNNYFQFKQFKIEQENCAMKVCTDSCLFGAWLQPTENVTSILDIGTGTGLLSLMLAQKSTAQIHAIEIDKNAYLQANENFDNSVWKDRLHVHLGDIKSFNFPNTFDFIITNPPFFKNEVESEMHTEKIAKHSLHLNLTELLSAIHRLLSDSGKFAILLPFFRKDELEKDGRVIYIFFLKKPSLFGKHQLIISSDMQLFFQKIILTFYSMKKSVFEPLTNNIHLKQ
jgi:tRNA1Val (adenine37-N6)-methyltransferase